MKKNSIKTNDDLQAELYLESYKLLLNDTMNTINLYDNLYKAIREELAFYEENEPLKLFQKAHKKWETSKRSLQKIYEKIFSQLRQEYKDLEEIIDLNSHQI